jgi:hypothetical protein
MGRKKRGRIMIGYATRLKSRSGAAGYENHKSASALRALPLIRARNASPSHSPDAGRGQCISS